MRDWNDTQLRLQPSALRPSMNAHKSLKCFFYSQRVFVPLPFALCLYLSCITFIFLFLHQGRFLYILVTYNWPTESLALCSWDNCWSEIQWQQILKFMLLDKIHRSNLIAHCCVAKTQNLETDPILFHFCMWPMQNMFLRLESQTCWRIQQIHLQTTIETQLNTSLLVDAVHVCSSKKCPWKSV